MSLLTFARQAIRLGSLSSLLTFLISTPVLSADLLSVYEQAKLNDKQFSASLNDYKAVQQGYREKKGLYYPTLALSYEHSETEQQINRSENDVFGSGRSEFPTDDLTLRLSQPVFRWDYLSERRKASAEVREAEYLFVASEQELMLRTAEAYLLALAARDNLFVSTAELDSVGLQVALAEKRLEVGLANPTEVHESNARYAMNNAEVIKTEKEVSDRNEALRVITGEDMGQLMPLMENFEMINPDPIDPDAWVSEAIQNNLSIKAREAALAVADEEYELQKSGRYPTIDLVARFNNRDAGGSLFGGGSDVDTTDIVLRADWTVFQGGSLRARIKEALYRKQRAEDDLELERSNVRRTTRNAYYGVVSSIAEAEALKASLDAQELTVQAKQKGFETGSASNIEVLDAKRDFFFVQRDYLEARYNYLLSRLNLKRQVGQLSPDDLSTINGLLETASIHRASELNEALAVRLPESVTGTHGQVEEGAVPGVALGQHPELAKVAHPGGYAKSLSDRRQLVSHQWLFDLSPDQFAIQMTSLDQEQQAVDYIVNNKLSEAHYFYSRDAGKDRYFVLAGQYSSTSEAAQAVQTIGQQDVFVRSVLDLQQARCERAGQQSRAVSHALEKLCGDSGLASMAGPRHINKTEDVATSLKSETGSYENDA